MSSAKKDSSENVTPSPQDKTANEKRSLVKSLSYFSVTNAPSAPNMHTSIETKVAINATI
jgi:hypothetical protein